MQVRALNAALILVVKISLMQTDLQQATQQIRQR
jgi:hypothetical protein